MNKKMNWHNFKSHYSSLGIALVYAAVVNGISSLPAFANPDGESSSSKVTNLRPLNEKPKIDEEKAFIIRNAISVPKFPDSLENTSNQEASEEINLVVKLNKKRVYVYQGKKAIANYPIAIGKKGYETPQGEFKVFSKEEDPIFKNFKTGRIIPPGKNNPLGSRWIGVWTDGKTQIGFHGTNRPDSVGKAVSHGCMRMHNQDVMALYEKVKLGTMVKIIP